MYYQNIADPSETSDANRSITQLSPAERETRLLKAVQGLRQHERVVRFTTRFVIASDNEWLAAIDTKTNENRIFPIAQINKHYAFFLPWAGMEKAQFKPEKHADTKAAEKMGKLFDALVTNNAVTLATDADRHGLNIFFTRLLFTSRKIPTSFPREPLPRRSRPTRRRTATMLRASSPRFLLR